MRRALFDQQLPLALAHLRHADPVLAELIDRLPPPAMQQEEDRFRALVRAIVNQQLSGRAAATITERLLSLFPAGIDPAAVLATEAEALRGAGLSQAKCRYLRGLAERIGSGSVDLQGIDRLNDADVVAQLTQIAGIGRWTAEMFLIFSLERVDVLPVGDLGLRAALRRHYALATLPAPAECEAIAHPWRPYASIATLYLWRSLESDGLQPQPAASVT